MFFCMYHSNIYYNKITKEKDFRKGIEMIIILYQYFLEFPLIHTIKITLAEYN